MRLKRPTSSGRKPYLSRAKTSSWAIGAAGTSPVLPNPALRSTVFTPAMPLKAPQATKVTPESRIVRLALLPPSPRLLPSTLNSPVDAHRSCSKPRCTP